MYIVWTSVQTSRIIQKPKELCDRYIFTTIFFHKNQLNVAVGKYT